MSSTWDYFLDGGISVLYRIVGQCPAGTDPLTGHFKLTRSETTTCNRPGEPGNKVHSPTQLFGNKEDIPAEGEPQNGKFCE
jgi:hypothetical protein